MFYLYSTPSCLEHKIHNFLAKVIEFVAGSIGIAWLNKLENKTISQAWRYLITTILISFCTYLAFSGSVNYNNSMTSDNLLVIFRRMNLSTYYIVIVVCLVMIPIQKENIRKCFNYAHELHRISKLLLNTHDDVRHKNCLLHKFLIKIGFDSLMIATIFVLLMVTVAKTPSISTFVNAILTPTSLVIYCFIGTVYYVSLAFSLFLIQKVHETLKTSEICDVSTFSLKIIRFVRKINATIQITLLLFVFHAFMGFVVQVRSDS